jgi:hypothetical protein
MRRADFTITPGSGEAFEKQVEVRIAVRQYMDEFARDKSSEMVLDRSNLVQ